MFCWGTNKHIRASVDTAGLFSPKISFTDSNPTAAYDGLCVLSFSTKMYSYITNQRAISFSLTAFFICTFLLIVFVMLILGSLFWPFYCTGSGGSYKAEDRFRSPISINRTFTDKHPGHLTNPTNFRLLVIKFRLTTPVSWPKARCLVSFAKILPPCPTVQFSGAVRIKVALHARHSINQPTNNFPAIRLNFLPAIRTFALEHLCSSIIRATCVFDTKI